VEDEGQHGNDETRTFLMINLSALRVTRVSCIVCQVSLLIYDKYPIIDGLFFLSPISYYGNARPVCLTNGWRNGGSGGGQGGGGRPRSFLNAVCMHCLDGSAGSLHCVSCRAAWPGTTFVIGTMYSYDVFAAMPCCGVRLQCKSCRSPVLNTGSRATKSFSDYSKQVQCPHCHAADYHFVKPLADVYRHFNPAVSRQVMP